MDLASLIAGGDIVVLSGAGLSTDSGIPDYRGETGRARNATPMTFQEFIGSPEARQRYWARSYVGWRRFTLARPNAGHEGVAALQRSGHVDAVITQNVDGLHEAAGSRRMCALHGRVADVVCLGCRVRTSRSALAHRAC